MKTLSFEEKFAEETENIKLRKEKVPRKQTYSVVPNVIKKKVE